jgi:hypothetical protein
MVISIIISSWNTCDLLRNCLLSINNFPPESAYEIIVIDNASKDGSVAMLRSEFPSVQLIENPTNVGFGAANNQGAKVAQGRYLLLLNSDTLVHLNAVTALTHYLDSNSQVAAVGPRLLNEDGSLQISAFRAPTLFNELWRLLNLDRLVPLSQYPPGFFEANQPRSVEVLNGACILIRADVVNRIGLFDEDFFMYSEEVDLCERIRRNQLLLGWEPRAEVTHFGGKSTSQVAEAMFLELYRNKIKFFKKNRGKSQAFFYKIILGIAAIFRIIGGRLFYYLQPAKREKWLSLAHRYLRLLGELGRM